jgi:hypothetical protein
MCLRPSTKGQRSIRTESAQIHDLRPDVEAAEAVRLGRQAGLVDGQLLDGSADVHIPELKQVIAIDRRHRRRSIEALAADARSRDEDFLECVTTLR